MLQLFLFLHVFGCDRRVRPDVHVFPVIASRARQSPRTGLLRRRSASSSSERIVLPGAVVQGITGRGLILILGADLTSSAYRWLVGGIVLYLIAIGYAAFVQRPVVAKMVHLTSSGPATRIAARRGAGRPAAGDRGDGPPASARRDAPRRPDRPHRDPDGDQADLLRQAAWGLA